ncbi:cellulose synthase/poly-beta-1,6-N-acetylglucosamine synthase-like glycosyltransferase [Metabacillus crassostreae]|uniref:glycosyltransferase family 2 protein n=1 Tax=Metabacillus crassostreae TaxID=929098 RepID=UPI00195CE14A|nr:glycosyltransferase [Metabacillus crassostreae]MBM7606271.1 cellulose synthase/poly-beta-1,6-N-acetylglucosamine synthase-like glycosyltransferase [Metabacillus crassostreae]
MKILLLVVMSFFWILLFYYSILAVAGVYHRLQKSKIKQLESYPSVAILIPAHNEGLVIADTLHAMSKINYPGELNIYVLDDASSDNTEEIASSYENLYKRIHYVKVPPGSPKGKSRVLNYGLSISQSDYFLVYDADNQPEPQAVKLLVEKAETTSNAAGAVGYVKTINANKNLLTRMIAIEFQVFQLLMQSGRWTLFRLGTLAGTNMLLKRSILEEMGGYDPYALAEDSELTIRVTSKGFTLPVVHDAKTWEQEPEDIKVFIRQRTRWLIGNIYILEKTFKDFSFWKGRTFFHSFQHVLTYLFFVFFLLFSNTWFVLSLIGFDLPKVDSPLLMFWFMSYVVYSFQILSSMVLDKTTSPYNVIVGIIMYFTYAQLFLILLTKSFYSYTINRIKNNTIEWDKTRRFKDTKEKNAA